MNKVVLSGRLTRDVEFKETGTVEVANYTLAVDRKFKKEGQPEADFIRCVVFGRSAEFAAKYFSKGMKVAVSGRIQTGSYTAQDGSKRYTTDVIVEEQEFGESKAQNGAQSVTAASEPKRETASEFEDAVQAELPFF